MKKIEAIIRREKFDDVKEALGKIGVDFFSFWDVRGCGKTFDEHQYRGTVYSTEYIERRVLAIVVNNAYVEKTIRCILSSAATGAIGDGKIFISEMEDAVRIRNGEHGPSAIYVKE